jgi:hypothetical protein
MSQESDLPPVHADAKSTASCIESPARVSIDGAERAWAFDLASKLRRGNPVRRLIDEILADQATSTPVGFLQTVLTDRSPRKWRERALAAWGLGVMPISPDRCIGVSSLLSDILGGQVSHDRFGTGLGRSFFVAFPFALLIGKSMILFGGDNSNLNLSNFLPALLGLILISSLVTIPIGLAISPIIVPASMARDKRRLNIIRSAAARALKRLQTPQAVAALAEGARDGDKTVRDNSLEALRTNLPRLSENDYGCLSSVTVPALCYLLNEKNKDLRVEILEALGKIGDGRALVPVTRLHAISKNDKVKDAAASIIPILTYRAEREKSAATLLRPIGPPEDRSVALLRPAGMSTEHEEAQLLRAVLADGE